MIKKTTGYYYKLIKKDKVVRLQIWKRTTRGTKYFKDLGTANNLVTILEGDIVEV